MSSVALGFFCEEENDMRREVGENHRRPVCGMWVRSMLK